MNAGPHIGRRIHRFISNMSIRTKVTSAILVVSLSALLLASAVMITVGWMSSRDSLLRDLTAQVEMLSDNCAAAISFEDEKDAEQLLRAFRAMHHVQVAAVYKKGGELLAGYSPVEGGAIPSSPPLSEGYRYAAGRIEIGKQVVLEGETIGSVFLRSDQRLVFSFIRILLATLGASLILAILVILTLTSWFQRFVSSPVIRLADVAKKVSEEKDFTIRASRETNDEIGLLTDTFNQTLEAVTQSNRALVTSERNYREIFNGMSDAIFILDSGSSDIVDVNDAALAMLGYTREELSDLGMGQLSSGRPPYTQDDVCRHTETAVSSGPQVFEWHSRRKNGELFWTEISLRLAEIGNTTRVIAVVRDIDDRKMMEGQLRQAQKMEAIGNLAGGIAHDFNNILQSIVGNTELALMQNQKNRTSKYLHNIETASQRAVEIVSQILKLSRQSDVEVRNIQMKHSATEALKLLRASIPKTIEFEVSIASERYVRADPARLHQILMNLCTNAYHAMQKEGGTLRVSLTDAELDSLAPQLSHGTSLPPGPYIKLTVEDTGEGIPPELMKRIFHPYFTTKEQGKGTGLGLSVVSGIIKGMNGRIEVESEVGEGTVFIVYLPAVFQKDEAKTLTASAPSRGTERVLIIDDEPSVATMCGSILEPLGYRTTVVTAAERGLNLFREAPDSFDILVTDMTMPGKTGLELAREIKVLRPDFPIVLVTGFSEELTQNRLATAVVDTVLMKPYSSRELTATLRALLDAPRVTPVSADMSK